MKKWKRQFGGKLTAELKSKYQSSPNWSSGKFQNIEETNMDVNFFNLPSLMYEQFFKKEDREPKTPIEIESLDHDKFHSSDQPSFVWYGHSALLMRVHGKNILIDPMLGSNAAPIAPFAVKRFSKNTLDIIDELPEIDLLLLSHDHYDHLDLDSFLKLKSKVKKYWVALGTGRHLKSWGIQESDVIEFDWWDHAVFADIKITFTPSRHFSGRGVTDRSRSMWGGWALQTANESIWFSGDGGYGDHFKKVGEHFGGFDFAFMECGQYHKLWRQIHMFPDESVQAALDANVKHSIPVHWGAFALALHPWYEPVNLYTSVAKEKNHMVGTPRPGATFGMQPELDLWWKDHK